MQRVTVLLALLFGSAFAVPAPQESASPTTSAGTPVSTVCGDIVHSNDTFVFNASTVYACLTSVPFNPAVATRFIKYYNDTLQFQSTLPYLKDPPAGYQQPATDLLGGLTSIQQAINDNVFPNQYSFEATLQNLINSAHDAHVQLIAGVLAAFTFASPYEIASVSIDGIQLPKIYVTDDLFANQTDGLTWQPSAVSKINDVGVIDYLTQFAALNAVGGLEPHADWNMLMQSAALDIQGYYEIFSGAATFYPGDTINFSFENGTSTGPLPFLAVYNSPGDTGPLETGGDFYNFFVLGFYPEAYFDELEAAAASSTTTDDSTTSETSPPAATSTTVGWDNPAYPTSDVVQPDLSIIGGGTLTGYFLNESSVAVLSIPSFDEYGDALGTFTDTISEFIERSQAAGMKKIVIDLQQNGGGDLFLAIDAFKQFFPSTEPFDGSRRRSFDMANALGETMTDYWEGLALDDEDYYGLSIDEWVIVDRLNAATGQNFSSWAEYYGPAASYKDYSFTETERYNFSSYIFDVEASGGIVVFGYDNRTTTKTQPFAAEDIVILTDGLCSSSCAVFMEMMHHEAGVKTVAVGGRPSYGPMQAPAESRGARMYSTDEMDADIGFVQYLDPDTLAVLPNRTADQDVYITFASINLRDQVRQGQDTPLQFVYEAADCRIFYTPQTWYNYSLLWQYAADATWTNPALCVQDSTGYATTAGGSSNTNSPPSASPRPSISSSVTNIIHLSGPGSMSNSLTPDSSLPILDATRLISSNAGQSCTSTCPGNFVCAPVSTCADGKTTIAKQCVPSCSSNQPYCTNGAPCAFQGAAQPGPQGTSDYQQGVCTPLAPKFCGGTSSSGRKGKSGSLKAPGPATEAEGGASSFSRLLRVIH